MGKMNNRSLSEERVGRLLDDLCTCLGFCLPPDEHSRLRANPPSDPDSFTDAVFVAEGLDPVLADRKLWGSVRDQVRRAFDR